MKRVILILAVLTLLLDGVGQANAGPLIYNISDMPTLQNGWTLSGTITTDGQLGMLAAIDILSFTFQATQGVESYTITGNRAGDISGLIATPSELALAIPTVVNGYSNIVFFDFSGPPPDLAHSQLAFTADVNPPLTFISEWNIPPGSALWNTRSSTAPTVDSVGWVIATSAAPEPASLSLLGIGIAGMVGYGWRRRKLASA